MIRLEILPILLQGLDSSPSAILVFWDFWNMNMNEKISTFIVPKSISWRNTGSNFPLTFQCSQCLWKPARNVVVYLQGMTRSPLEQVFRYPPQFCNPNSWFPHQAPFLKRGEGGLVKKRIRNQKCKLYRRSIIAKIVYALSHRLLN